MTPEHGSSESNNQGVENTRGGLMRGLLGLFIDTARALDQAKTHRRQQANANLPQAGVEESR